MSLRESSATKHFEIALLVSLVIPLLALGFLFSRRLIYGDQTPSPYDIAGAFALLLLVLGFAMLSRYPLTVVRLRKYLENIARGELSVQIDLKEEESDIRAIETCLNTIIQQLRSRVSQMQIEQVKLEMQLCHAHKLEVIGQMAAGIAHEINTPIQFVGDNTRFLDATCGKLFELLTAYRQAHQEYADQIPPEADHKLRQLEDACDINFLGTEIPKAIQESLNGLNQTAEIARAMKNFSRMIYEDTRQEMDLNQAIQDTVIIARNEWKHHAKVTTDLDPSTPPILCCPGDIKQVLLNLLVNAAHAIAARHTEKGSEGHISLSTSCASEDITIRIQDNGCGIPEELRERIFEPFFTTKTGGKGSGQGLAISRRIIEQHGGTMLLKSEPGKGTTFRITLPLKPTEKGAEAS